MPQDVFTPPKANMEPENGGLVQMVQMVFLFKQVIFRFQPLVFGDVFYGCLIFVEGAGVGRCTVLLVLGCPDPYQIKPE